MGMSQVRQININEEMRHAYLDYAMSVIVSRALPDARDGLKPVHRRILYAMHDMGSGPTAPYRKSARIVGEVLGKYHPHGDVAVYEAMVRMAQSFSMRYELIDGQGNFGSIDGDAAAAMRYTEARMAALGNRLLDDIDKNTVAFGGNFDNSLQEPLVLPASFPNLIVNGASGIAVGMSTSVPPHNLGEVCNALVYMLEQWEQTDEVTVTDLMKFIQGPDFPTGGIVYRRYDEDGEDHLLSAYATGRGKVIVRAKVHLESLDRGRSRIIVSEIPYQTNKSSLIERIAELAQNGKVEGLVDLRDESDRQGLRIVIEVSRTADPAEVLSDLFKYTPLQSTFSVIMLALVDGEPRLLPLKQALRIYIEHRLEVIRRRSEFDLEKAEHRAHILEGLLKALDSIDQIIETIKRSRSADSARNNLMRTFGLSEAQAQAILDMRLRRLAQLERKELKDEYDSLIQLIKDLTLLLGSPVLMRMEVKRELLKLKEDYLDRRRTAVIDSAPTKVTEGDLLIPQEMTYITLTREGKLSRTYVNETPILKANADDSPLFVQQGTTVDILYLITANGEAAGLPVSQIPQAEPLEGQHFSTLGPLKAGEIVGLLSISPMLKEGYVFFMSRLGEVKRLRLEDLPGVRVDTFRVFDVEANDCLIGVEVVFDNEEALLVTQQGLSMRFNVNEVRPTGISAGGMRGVKLRDEGDRVVGGGVVAEGSQLLVMTADLLGKRSNIAEYPTKGRGGIGVRTFRPPKGMPHSTVEIAALIFPETEAYILNTHGEFKRLPIESIPHTKRDYRPDYFLASALQERFAALTIVKPPIELRIAQAREIVNGDEEMTEDETLVNGEVMEGD